MKSIIWCIVFAVIAVISTGVAIKTGAQVVEIQDKLDGKVKEIAKLNKDHAAEIKKLQAKHDEENEIQYQLANLLSNLSLFNESIKGKLDEILKRPVYSLRCSDADGVREINKYAGKKPSEISNR